MTEREIIEATATLRKRRPDLSYAEARRRVIAADSAQSHLRRPYRKV